MFDNLTYEQLLIIIRKWEKVADKPTTKKLSEVLYDLLADLKAYNPDGEI